MEQRAPTESTMAARKAPRGKNGGKQQPRAKTSACAIATKELLNEILRLRKLGMPYRDIATKVDRCASQCCKMVKDYLAALPMENAQELRQLQFERLNTIHALLAAKLVKSENSPTETVLRIVDRYHQNISLQIDLCGLKVTKHELTGKDGAPIVEATPQQARQVVDELFRTFKVGAIETQDVGDAQPAETSGGDTAGPEGDPSISGV
jgi:hypothetical protein